VLEFLAAAREHAFLQRALLAGLLSGIACGVVGTYVAARRITYIAGGISHSVLGGMGAARFLAVRYDLDWLRPIHGALFAALLAAAIIGTVSLRCRQNEDTVISALWAIGMALGVVFISRTPGYNEDLMSYLFGNILMVAPGDVWLLLALDVVVVLTAVLLYEQFLAVCFDEEFARLRGLPVDVYYLGILALTACAVVLLMTVVGLVLVIALLTLPVAIASRFSRSLWQVMVGAAVLSTVFTASGLALSYGPSLPAGATTILVAGAVYLLVLIASRFLRRPTPPSAAARSDGM